MVYYPKEDYKLLYYERSNTKNKMYDAVLQSRTTGKKYRVPFGDSRYQNYRDKTGLDLYPQLIHGDKKRRILYRARHKKDIKEGFYSPGWFSYFQLW